LSGGWGELSREENTYPTDRHCEDKGLLRPKAFDSPTSGNGGKPTCQLTCTKMTQAQMAPKMVSQHEPQISLRGAREAKHVWYKESVAGAGIQGGTCIVSSRNTSPWTCTGHNMKICIPQPSPLSRKQPNMIKSQPTIPLPPPLLSIPL